MSVDIDAVSRLIREVAEREVLPLFRRLAGGDVWEKRPGAVVTVADTRAEAALDAGLRGLLPGSRVVAEEACEKDPGILAELERPGAVWVVDPIDGTANFAEGDPRFAVMVALVGNGETTLGWIYHPVSESMSVAERGSGAWRDGAKLAAAAAAPPAAMTGALRGRVHRALSADGRFAEVTDNKCCGVDYLALSAGTSHFAFYRSLKPWDHAAGHLLHCEAGGFSACLDGAPYRPGRRDAGGGSLLAPDRESWSLLARDIRSALGTPA